MQLKRNKGMEFETLKKNYRKQVIIGALAVCVIGGALTFNLTRAKYRIDKRIDLAKGTVNYKAYDFKIMAMYKSEDGSNYNEISDMPSSGYVINEEKTYCTTDNKTQVKGKIKTENGKHYIESLSKSDKCYLYFDKEMTASEKILVGVTVKSGTPDFSQIATTDEGVYSVADGMYGGSSYYWRGAVTNNYVKFANFCWRIVRINGDGSIRLIYDGATCNANGTNTSNNIAVASTAYNLSSDRSEYVGWTYSIGSQRPTDNTSATASNIKSQTDNWYSANIGNNTTYTSYVADGKYCNDRSVKSGNTWAISPSSTFYYAVYSRIYETYQPTLSCPSGDVYTLKIGLITADEIMHAGGSTPNNTLYYLYNGQIYWSMSPTHWWYGSSTIKHVSVATVNASGQISNEYVQGSDNTNVGLRPVINLRSDITFSGGDGTLNNPYVVQ